MFEADIERTLSLLRFKVLKYQGHVYNSLSLLNLKGKTPFYFFSGFFSSEFSISDLYKFSCPLFYASVAVILDACHVLINLNCVSEIGCCCPVTHNASTDVR